MIAVIIPYFQREAGILRRALASVAAQSGCTLPLHVIVIDDESPAPAQPEIDALGAGAARVQLLQQRNAGPAVARNAGLNAAPIGSRYVAFLDSDDEWACDHLARAVHALEMGYDFFFGDHYQLGQCIGAFARGGRIVPSEHLAIGHLPGLHAYQGDMLDQIIRGNVIGTSTVVYDFQRFQSLRFRPEFTSAGEDYLFWMSIAASKARIAFSSLPEATYGRGVNVYAGAGWGTEGHLLRVHNELRYRKTIGRLFPVSRPQKEHIDRSVGELRRAFASDLLHRLGHGKSLPLKLLARHLALDLPSFALLPIAALRRLARRA